MIYILFFICLNFGGTFARQETDFPVITLNITRGINDFVCQNVYNPKLIWGSPFNIKVFSEVFIDNANCSDGKGKYHFTYKFKKENEYYLSAQTISAKKHINTLKCDFYISYCKNYSTKCSRDEPEIHTIVDCTFPENIRYPDLAYMTANLNRLNTSIAFGQESYDVMGKHKFFEGEQVQFSCVKTSKKNNLIAVFRFSTTNVKENRTFVSDTIKDFKASIYIKLTTAYDGGYIDCFVASYDQVQKLIIRIQLELNKEPMSGRLGFKVNGVILSAEMEDNHSHVYTYAYVDGETLAVQSIKDRNMHGKMSCLGENFPANLEDYKTPQDLENVDFTTVLKENDGNVTLNCLVSCIYPYKDKLIYLKLVKQIYSYYPYINGLLLSKIMEMDKNDDGTVIRYDYDGELLNLKCYSDMKAAEWHYNETEVTQTKNEFNKNVLETNDYYAYGEFKLNSNISYSTISCTYKGKKVKVELIGKNKYITPTQNYDTSPKPEDDPTVKPEGSTGAGKLPLELKKFIIGACITIIVIIIVLILTITCIKRKKNKETLNPNTTDILYENLPKHNEQENKSTLQLCNNEEVYAAPVDNLDQSIYAQPYTPQTVEEMYSAVVPKNQRANLDSSYANSGDPNPNSKTATNKIKHGLNYIKVFPKEFNRTSCKQKLLKKSKKVIDDNSPYAEVTMNESPYAEVISNESPYAEVTSKDSTYAEVTANKYPYAEVVANESPYAEVMANKTPYSEVIPTESAYAEPFNNTDNKYTNVFDNERYVNAKAKNDYAEPAYCELKSSEVKK